MVKASDKLITLRKVIPMTVLIRNTTATTMELVVKLLDGSFDVPGEEIGHFNFNLSAFCIFATVSGQPEASASNVTVKQADKIISIGSSGEYQANGTDVLTCAGIQYALPLRAIDAQVRQNAEESLKHDDVNVPSVQKPSRCSKSSTNPCDRQVISDCSYEQSESDDPEPDADLNVETQNFIGYRRPRKKYFKPGFFSTCYKFDVNADSSDTSSSLDCHSVEEEAQNVFRLLPPCPFPRCDIRNHLHNFKLPYDVF